MSERRTLVLLVLVNATMFVVEAVAGWRGESTGLLADALDMLADAMAYGVALYAVGRSGHMQARAASVIATLEIVLGCGILIEVGRRFVFGSVPESLLMVGVGTLALAANVWCLRLITRHRDGGIHMRASWVFSRNDVLANLGVIASGILVASLGTRIPDLVIGAIVGAIVVRAGVRVLRESRRSL